MDNIYNVLLINPPIALEVYSEKLHDFWLITPPYSLLVLAASIIKIGANVKVLDADADMLSDEEIVSISMKFKPKYIGFTVMTPSVYLVKRICSKIKKKLPDVKIILGGVHATALPFELMNELQDADYLIKGEANEILTKLIKSNDKIENLSNIEGLLYRNQKKDIIANKGQGFIDDINKLPMPAWDIIDLNKYRAYRLLMWNKQYVKPYAPIFTSWGCPGTCSFCSNRLMHGNKVRFRDPEKVLEEIDYLVQKCNVKSICIQDDSFTIKKNHTYEICHGLINRKYDISLMCQSRADTIDEDMINLFKKAGFTWISFGIESGSQKILDQANKKLTKKILYNTVLLTHKSGLNTHLNFIVGLPGENSNTIKETIDFAKQLKSVSYGFSFATPFPGTKLWDFAAKNSINLTTNWNYYDWVNYPPQSLNKNITSSDLKKFRKRIIRKVIISPSYIFRIIQKFGIKIFLKFFIVDGIKVFSKFILK